MALFDREVAIAVAATATAMSPKARETVRKGAVYGLAGVLKAGDAVVAGARGAARGAAEGVTSHDGAGAGQPAQQPAPAQQRAPAQSGSETPA